MPVEPLASALQGCTAFFSFHLCPSHAFTVGRCHCKSENFDLEIRVDLNTGVYKVEAEDKLKALGKVKVLKAADVNLKMPS